MASSRFWDSAPGLNLQSGMATQRVSFSRQSALLSMSGLTHEFPKPVSHCVTLSERSGEYVGVQRQEGVVRSSQQASGASTV